MDLTSWLQISFVCAMGAVSPGPSLAVVVRNTLAGGKRQGLATALGHGLGILIYAGLVVTGLAVALSAHPAVKTALTYAGIALLIWLGLGFAGIRRAGGKPADESEPPAPPSHRNGFTAGFLIAFLNPKIAAFFLAIFAPFIHLGASGQEKAVLAMTAGAIDAGWYALVALLLSGSGAMHLLRRHAQGIERAIGILLLLIAAGLVYRMV